MLVGALAVATSAGVRPARAARVLPADELFPAYGIGPGVDAALDDDEGARELKNRVADSDGLPVRHESAHSGLPFVQAPPARPVSRRHVTFTLGARGPPRAGIVDLWRQA